MRLQASAGERARWLSELAEALEDAQKLAWRVGLIESDSAEAMELYGRLEAARMEVQSLRFGPFGAALQQYGSEWTEIIPWENKARD